MYLSMVEPQNTEINSSLTVCSKNALNSKKKCSVRLSKSDSVSDQGVTRYISKMVGVANKCRIASEVNRVLIMD